MTGLLYIADHRPPEALVACGSCGGPGRVVRAHFSMWTAPMDLSGYSESLALEVCRREPCRAAMLRRYRARGGNDRMAFCGWSDEDRFEPTPIGRPTLADDRALVRGIAPCARWFNR